MTVYLTYPCQENHMYTACVYIIYMVLANPKYLARRSQFWWPATQAHRSA